MGNVSNASSETELRGALGLDGRARGTGRRDHHRDGGDDAVRLHGRLLGRHAPGGRRGDRSLPAAQGLRRLARRPAGDDRRARRPRDRGRGVADPHAADRARASTIATTRTRTRSCGSATALGKYWICKRAPGLAAEAMECVGGSGVMEDSPMPRLYREAPVNAIWEGSGNVQCLDILRAVSRSPQTLAPISPRSTRRGRERRARRPCRGPEGRHARPLGLRASRARPLRPARDRPSGRGADPRRLSRRRRLLPLAAREPRRALLRRADGSRLPGDRRAGGGAVNVGAGPAGVISCPRTRASRAAGPLAGDGATATLVFAASGSPLARG